MPRCTQTTENKQASQAKPAETCDSSEAKCPLEDQVRVTIIREVVMHAGNEVLQSVSARSQYINLDENVDSEIAWAGTLPSPRPQFGRVIRLKARVQWVAGDQYRALSGKKVYWYDKPGGSNRPAAKLEAAERASFDSAGGNKRKKETTTDEQGWTPVVEYHLSQYGGDKFEIYATEDSEYKGGVKVGPFEIWRRMWYQVTEMQTQDGSGTFEMTSATTDYVKDAFKKVYVELRDSGERVKGEFKGNLRTHSQQSEWAKKYCTSKFTPWKIHYAVVHHAAGREQKTLTHTMNGAAAQTFATQMRPYDFDGTNWLVRGRYRNAATNGWRNLPNGAVTLSGSNPRRNIRVDLATVSVDPSKRPTEIEVKYLKASPVNGWGGVNLHLIICAGSFNEYYSAADRPKVMAGTSIHEPGHTMGLVYSPLAWETSDAARRAHCKYNDCVMWWQGYLGRPHDFHPPSKEDPGCHTHVRGMDMSRSAMNSKWKFP